MQRIPKDLWAVVHSLTDRYQISGDLFAKTTLTDGRQFF